MSASRIPVIDLKRQYAALKAEIDEAVRRVVESGYYVMGPEVRAFEQEWARYCGTEHCVALANGTDSLHLALRALGVGPGDEVVTVAFTLSATLDAIIALGARPVLVDIDPSTYTMDPALVPSALSPRTKAVLPVHIYGHPADMDAILEVASAAGLPVVADSCEAHGTLYRGKQVNSLAHVSCFSFYPTKGLNAMGDAGAIVTNDAGLAERVRRLRVHGWDRRFHSAESSLNSRMDEIHGAVLRTKLPHLDAWNRRRNEIAARYDAAVAGSSVRPAPHAPWATPSYYLYVIATPERDALRRDLDAAGIDSDVHWPEPPHLQPAFAHLGYEKGSLPVTERVCNEVLTLPMFPELTDAEVDRVCDVLRRFAARTASLPVPGG
ncbi:MAG TPA: DegT/DnrJ/EryC1/StrS family aminotransferase [Dehalococcoidia bacterium]|nr:DegT/DnrJ/EryC1/StrS family aminotransferase [Dehalococcoidia bacterium]